MIPVTQTKVVIRNSKGEAIVRGNCLAACVASMMELPITEVPNVEVLFDIEDNWYHEVLIVWLHSKGWDYCTDSRFACFHPKAYGSITQERFAEELKDKLYLVSGNSSRGVRHICIYQNGKLIHDPHPTKEGLLTEEFFESLEPFE